MYNATDFRVFDRRQRSDPRGYSWCMRCEDWIPVWGEPDPDIVPVTLGGVDVHVSEHLTVWLMLATIARRQWLKGAA